MGHNRQEKWKFELILLLYVVVSAGLLVLRLLVYNLNLGLTPGSFSPTEYINMDEDDGFNLLPAKRKKRTNFKQCIMCQSNKESCLRNAQTPSIEKLIYSANVRKDEVFERLHVDFSQLKSLDVLWHNSCYACYTSEHNLQSLATDEAKEVNSSKFQQRRVSFDWTKCLFCRNASRKGDLKLINIATFDACNTIRLAAETRCDEELLLVISVNYDMIAVEGKYHKSCHATYVSKKNL